MDRTVPVSTRPQEQGEIAQLSSISYTVPAYALPRTKKANKLLFTNLLASDDADLGQYVYMYKWCSQREGTIAHVDNP